MSGFVQRTLQQKTPPPTPEAEAFLAIQIAATRLLDPWARYLKTRGMTPGQYNVLRILRGARPEALTCSEIAERMISRDPDITRLLDRLERQQLVQRERDAQDRRVVRTRIAPAGLDLLAELDAPSARLGEEALGPMGARKLAQLTALLATVIEHTDAAADVLEGAAAD